MIKEDYISFETAKLLKEKGFECEKNSTTAMYNELGVFLPLSTAAEELYRDYNDFDEYDYIAPTFQMAMKWLREVHGLQCDIGYDDLDWFWNIISIDKTVSIEDRPKLIKDGLAGYKTYEEACEAAIKYCLENLI